jgi:hypothetical protein
MDKLATMIFRNSLSLVALIGLTCLLVGARDGASMPRYEWDLASDHNYATRTEHQVRTLGALDTPGLFFLDNDTVAVVYRDGRAAQSWDSPAIVKGRVNENWPNYKLHALIFDLATGPKSAKELQWNGITRQPQFFPLPDGGFVLRIDDRLMVYSSQLQLVKETKLELHASPQLPNGQTIHEEFNTVSLSVSGKSVVTCHTILIKKSDDDRADVRWLSTESLEQIGKSSTSKLVAGGGCGNYFTATDDFAIMGKFRVAPDGLPWKEFDLGINDCNMRGPYRMCDKYELLDDSHLLSSARTVIDFNGAVSYVLPRSPIPGAGGIKPDVNSPQPHSSRASRIAYDEGAIQRTRTGGHEDRIYVADWKSGKQLLNIRVTQKKLPVIRGNGLREERAGMLDLNYALSPDGTKLAILNLDKLGIYDVP